MHNHIQLVLLFRYVPSDHQSKEIAPYQCLKDNHATTNPLHTSISPTRSRHCHTKISWGKIHTLLATDTTCCPLSLQEPLPVVHNVPEQFLQQHLQHGQHFQPPDEHEMLNLPQVSTPTCHCITFLSKHQQHRTICVTLPSRHTAHHTQYIHRWHHNLYLYPLHDLAM